MYRLPRLLSTAEVAEAAGLAESSIRAYRTRGKTPAPDAMIGSVPGWLPATAQAWAETLPSRAASEPPQPATGQPPADPVAAARDLVSMVRAAIDTSGLDAPEQRSPYRDPVRQAGWAAAGHLARTAVAYEALPWVELAEHLGDLGEVLDPDEATEVLRIAAAHLSRARVRLDRRRPAPDWDDHIAVAAELEHVARRAADLRMVSMLADALSITGEEVAR